MGAATDTNTHGLVIGRHFTVGANLADGVHVLLQLLLPRLVQFFAALEHLPGVGKDLLLLFSLGSGFSTLVFYALLDNLEQERPQWRPKSILESCQLFLLGSDFFENEILLLLRIGVRLLFR